MRAIQSSSDNPKLHVCCCFFVLTWWCPSPENVVPLPRPIPRWTYETSLHHHPIHKPCEEESSLRPKDRRDPTTPPNGNPKQRQIVLQEQRWRQQQPWQTWQVREQGIIQQSRPGVASALIRLQGLVFNLLDARR